MKKTKLVIFAVAALVCALFFLGCDWGCNNGCNGRFYYEGSYLAQQNIATNSLLGVAGGNWENGIAIVEEDEYGRSLFLYYDWSVTAADDYKGGTINPHLLGLLISQKSDKKYVHYYSDINFIIKKIDRTVGGLSMDEYRDLWIEYFSDEEIAALKAKNDWGKPIDEDKCVKTKLRRKARNYTETLVSDENMKIAYDHLWEYSGKGNWGGGYVTSDSYERHLYYFRKIDFNEEKFETEYMESYVIIFNPDGTFDEDKGVMEIIDLWNYQYVLKAFKIRNNWNKPLEK